MKRLRLFILMAFAVLAVASAAASSASAAFTLSEKKCDEGKPTLCWEAQEKGVGLQELVGEEEFTITQEGEPEPLLEAKFGTEVVHIQCKEGTGSGTVKQTEPLVKETTGTGTITFKGCELLEPLAAKCTVPAEIKTKEITGTFANTKEVKFKATVGEIFVEIKFGGEKCPATIKGAQPVRGEAVCFWLEDINIDLAGHLCEVTHESGTLKLGANAASLLAEFEVHFPTLEKTDLWDLVLG